MENVDEEVTFASALIQTSLDENQMVPDGLGKNFK